MAADSTPAATVAAPPAGIGGAARVFACLVLFSMANAAFWVPSLAGILEGLFAGAPSAAFANRDFANYWLSGRLALGGDVSLLAEQVTHQAALEAAFGMSGMEPRAWSYPPHLLLVTWPLGFLSYPAAYALFMAGTGGWFTWTVWSWSHRAGGANARTVFYVAMGLLVPFFVLQVLAGQNGFFFGAAMLQALYWRRTRPMAAGLMLAVLTMKPQLGLLLPLLLLAERRFATIAWAAAFTAGLIGLSAAIFGVSAWTAFFEITLPYQQYVSAHWGGQFLYMMPTWFAAFRAAGLAYGPSLALHACLAAPLVLACLYAMVRSTDEETRSRLLLAGTFVLTPYAFNYDMGALLATVAVPVAVRAVRQGGDWVLACAAGLVLALPLWTPLLGRGDAILVLPPLVVSGLLLVWTAPAFRAFPSALFTKSAPVS